jgi:hypothetical protein
LQLFEPTVFCFARCSNFVPNYISQFLGSLVLVCEVEFLPPGGRFSVGQEQEEEVVDVFAVLGPHIDAHIRDSLRSMLQNELFTDCTIQVFSHYFLPPFSLFFICL